MLRQVLLFIVSLLIFFAGCLFYGALLNLRETSIDEVLLQRGKKSIERPTILINRKSNRLRLYDDTVFIKEYKAMFGRNPQRKTQADDMATPFGDYKICAIDSNYIYYRFLQLDYPNDKDIDESYRMGKITQKEFEDLRFSYFYKKQPDWSPVLGGRLGIHAIGRLNFIFKNLPFAFNWTGGDIAISNEDMDEIFRYVQIGTQVRLR
jgi:hypothetical protein